MPNFRLKSGPVFQADQWFPGKLVDGIRDDFSKDGKARIYCGCLLIGGHCSSKPHVHPSKFSSVFVMPGEWIISLGDGFYDVISDEKFHEKYELFQ